MTDVKAGVRETGGSVLDADGAVRRAGSFPYYTSGSGNLDGLLGGGFRGGSLTEIHGKSNSGKSQVAMQASLCAAERGETVLYVDTEGSFRPERIEEMATARGWETRGVLERIVYVRSDTSSEQMEVVRRMGVREATAGCRLVIVDTLTKNFSVDFPGRSNMQRRQGALDVHLSEMARDAALYGRAYLLTNRVTFGATKDIGIGGKTVEQLVHRSLLLEREEKKVKATDIQTGEASWMEVGAAGVD